MRLMVLAAAAVLVLAAVFEPAADRRGRVTEGTHLNRVRWEVPQEPRELKPSTLIMSAVVEERGKFTGCVIEKSLGLTPDDVAEIGTPCEAGTQVRPLIDAQGRAVRRRVRNTFITTVEPIP